jgi:T1SS-143 domain-containing protein
MNGPFQVAQANIAGESTGKPPARVVKISKPFSEQSVVVPLSYDGSVKADLSAIAGEKITLVHIGEKLIILFDNKSTITLEPFFDSTGKPLDSLTIEVSPGRDLTGAEFATLFPVTEDQSVLPAAGEGGNAQASGANFSSVGVDPLALPNPLDLLPQEELPNFVITNLLTPLFIDDTPTASDFSLALDEDEIPNAGGNAGGINDINAPSSFSGILPHGFGLDLAGDINFASMNGTSQTIHGITVTFAWDQASHTLTANDGSNDVFSLIVTDPATGAYTVTLLHALHHHTDALADNNETSNTFDLVFTVVDGNGTAVNATMSLEINDDTPLPTENGVSVSVNENDIFTVNSVGTSPFDGHTELATGAALVTGTLAGTMTFGADGPGNVQFGFVNEAAVLSYMESLNLFSKQAALPENGKELTYQLAGNVLTASEPDPQGNVVFTLTVNSDGTFEFRLFDELIHMPVQGENTDLRGSDDVPATTSVPFIQFGNIVAAFDGDGDGTPLGANFKITIVDDVPEAYIFNNPLGVVQHDETPGVQVLEDTNDASVKALFAGGAVVNPGDDPDVANNGSDTAIGYARSLLPLVLTLVNIGADSPAASQTLSLQLIDGATGQPGGANLQLDSGLTTTEGNKIILVKEGDLIIGRVLGTGDLNGVDQTDPAAFAIHIGQDGRVSIVQYLSLHHPDTTSNDEAVDLDSVALDGLIAAQISVTDSDGDTATAFVNIGGNIRFDDDGPAVSIQAGATEAEKAAIALNLDETVQPNGGTNPSYDRTLGLEPQDANGGADDVDPTNSTTYNRTPVASTAPNADQAIGHTETATGLLDDLFNAPVINFGADGPAAGGGVSHLLSLVLSSASVATTLHVTALTDNPLLQGLSFADRTISLVKVSDTVIEGRIPGADHVLGGADDYVAFRITLTEAGDPANAKISIDQFLPIDHGGTENPSVFDEQALLTLVGNGTLALKDTVTVTDGDGDSRTASAQVTLVSSGSSFISFDDDGPLPLSISAANGAANGLFFDGFVPNSDAWGAGSGINNSGTAGAWHIAASDVQGASTIQLERVGDNYRGSDSPTNSVMVDLEATPGNIKVSQDLTLTAGAVYHLTFEIGAANDPGVLNSAELQVFWNGVSVGTYIPVSGVMQTISIDVTAAGANNQLTFQEIGKAGDNTGTFLANVKLSDVIIIDETKGVQPDSDDTIAPAVAALFAGVSGIGNDPDMGSPQYAQGQHSVVVLGTADFGTDGPAATNPIQIGLSVSSAGVDSGLTTTEGKAIHLYVEGALVVGRFDSDNNGTYDTAAFALSIDPNGGILSIAQYVSLHHPIIGDNDEGVYLANGSLLATVTLTDGDGDHTTTSADISSAVRFEDDGPSIDPLQNSSLRDWTIDEDMLPAAGHSTPTGNDALDNPADTNDYTQINDKPLGVTWGADGPKALTFAAIDSQHPTITVTDQNGNPQAALTSGGVALVYGIATNADGGQTLVAYKGSASPANEVFKLTLDPDAGTSGTFSFELTGALDHPIGGGQNTLNLRFDFTATDGDGDTATSFLTMRITDDVPYASGTVISRTVDEDDINTPWSHGTSPNDGSADGSTTENSTGAAFISGTLAGLVAPGADLPGTFSFATNAVAQLTALGLFSKQSALGNGENGKPLGYVISNGPVGSNEIVITGNEPNPQGNPVFSLTLNTVTGAYEFRLFDELIHMPGDGQNDDLRSGQPSGNPLVQNSIPYLDLGSIITYTDKDGDTVNLGGKFTVTITDDAPHADIDIGRGSVTIDETPGNQADDTTSSSVRNLFAALEATFVGGVRLVGDDPDVDGDNNGGNSGNGAIAYAHSNFAVVVNDSTIGSDSPPYPHQYALSIVGGAASGLFVTDGSPINLSVNADGLVIGTVVGGAFNGKVAFAIAIESDGEVSVAQYLSLKHDDRGDSNETNDNGTGGGNDASPNDTPNPVQQNLNGKILVTLTVTDSDGDQSTDTANIGNLITFLDDGPSLHSNSTVSLEDDDLAGGNEGGPGDDNAPLNASGTLSHDYGADGPGSTLLTGFNLPSGQGFTAAVSDGGLTLTIKQNGIDVLRVTLTDSTYGNYTVTQLHAIDHPTQNGQSGDDTENNVEFTVSYRVTDGDGDFIDGSLKINVDDDTPEPNFVLQSGKLVTIDETAGLQNATATPGVNGDSNDNDTSNPFPVAVTNPGVPAADSTLFGAPQVAQSNGAVVAVTPHYGADGPGSIVFAIDVPGSSTSSGLTTVSGQPITLFEVNSTLIVGRYDGPDGGSGVGTNDPAAFAIHIDPTTGVISVIQYVAIKHDDRGDFDEDNDNGSNSNDALSNDFPDPVQQSIINSAIRVTVTVTDHDGDSVGETFNVGNKIVFEDDGPTISITAIGEAGVVLTTQDADTIGNATDTAMSAANFSGVFAVTSSYGADGGGSTSLSYSLAVTGPVVSGRVDSSLDSNGLSIYLYDVGGTIVGSTALNVGAIADGNKIFSVSVSSSGVVTLTQFQQIDHPIANDPSASGAPFDDQTAVLGNGLISLTRSGSITDGDGDTATASAVIDLGGNIQFTDHGPSATTTASLNVDEDDLSAGNHDTTSPGDDNASASLTGTLGFIAGADSPAIVSFQPLGGAAVVDANGHPVTSGGVALTYLWVAGTNTLYASTDGTVGGAAFKIEVTNPSTGAYSFSLLGAVDHPGHDADGLNNGPETAYEDNININLTYTVADFDKDTATGTLSISIDDDMPILPAAPTNVIVNGDFSQGTFASASFGGIATAPGSITGWVFANSTFDPPSNLQVERVNDGYLGLHTSTHGSMIDMGASPGNIEISQQLSGLTPGQAYAISFEAGAPYPSTAELQVLWNNVVIGTIDPSGPMTSYAYIVNATGIAANDQITFREVGQGHAVIPGQADEGYHGTYLANVSVIATNFVDEDGLASGNHDSQVGDNVVPNTDGDNNEATTVGSLGIQWGADNSDVADTTAANTGFIQDGALGAALTGRSVFFTDNSVSFTGASTLTSDGVAINFVLSNNNTKLQGFAGSREVFEVTLSDDGSGQYRFILKDLLDHAPSGNENDIALTFNFTAKDSDGDAVSGHFVIGIDDDVPVITAAADVVTLDEALLLTDGNPGGITQANVGFLHISWGADDGAAKHLAFVKDGNGQVIGPALTSDGVALDYFIREASDSPGNEQLVAVKHGDDPNVDSNLVFSITLYEQGSGYYAFALYQNIDHAPGADTSTLNFGIKAYDSDGDAVQTALTVKVTDDVPHALSNAPLAVDEDDLSAGNHDTTSPGDDAASASLSGTLGFTAGADSPATVSFLPLGGAAVVDANGHPVTSGGLALTYFWVAGTNTLYASTDGTVGGAAFKIEVTNPSTGAYSFSLLGQLDHPGHDDPGVAGTQTAYEDNININLTYTVTDFDQDTATGTLSISIDDDMPIIGASPAPANLILNGSFEDHNGQVSNPGFNTFTTIDHWTSGPDNVPFEIQQGNIGDLLPQDGNAKVELDSDPLNNPTSQLNATIQQTISTALAAGDSYELSFWYSPRPNDGDPDSSSLKVYWNGVVVHTIDSSTQADGWQHVSVIVTAQAGSNTVAFQGDGQPNQLGAYLDNVSLVPAITVDEDGLTGPFAFGNHDSQPGDNVVPNTEGLGVDNNEATATGNLNIQWGADNIDSGVDGVSVPFNSFVQDQPNGVGDRSVTFTNDSVAVTGVSALYSHGDLVTFVLNADHTVLSGVAGAGASARTVFEVSLSDEGTAQFRFVLLDKLDHAPGNNENDIGLSFNFTATDSDGDAVSGSFVVGVDDDVPVANDDTYSPTITGPTIISGLFDNDAFGADGVDATNATPGQVTVTNGAHGTVVYNNDGTFTYTPNAGHNGQDSFTYTIKDGDGDVSTATVTLSSVITNTIPTAGDAFATVDDEGLTGGNDGNGQSSGDVAGNAFTASGTLPHSFVNDGPATSDPVNFSLANNVAGFVGSEAVIYHWNDITNTLTATSADRGDIFEIVVDGGLDNGNGNYVFTLLQPVLHAPGDGENDATVVLNYQVVDGTTPADTAVGTLTITIDDDTPLTTALADSVSVNEGNLPSDRNPVAANPVGIAQSGTGFLHISWGADNGADRHLEFAKDGNSNPIGPSLTADGVPLLYVIRAPGDSAGNEQIVAYKQGDDPDTNPVFSITLYEGGDGYYTYVQYQNIDHNGVGTDSKTFGFTINAFDADGDSVSQTLTINVTDDVPVAYSNTNSVIEGGIVGGNVLTDGTHDVFGADGAILTTPAGGVVGVRAAGVDLTSDVLTGIGMQITGVYGKLTLNSDGTYSYDGNPDAVPPAGASDVFVYTIKDGDGDTSTTTLTINLTDSGITAANDDVTVNEAALPVGSTPASTAETVTGTVADNIGGGTGPFTYVLVGTGTGSHGTLTFNPDGSYSYTLTSPVTGPQADNSTNTENNAETFTYNVTDANGNTATNTITIDVIDDVPHANLNTGSVTEGGILTVAAVSGVLANDVAGADGYAAGGGVVGVRAAGADTTTAVTTGVATTINGQFGTLVLQADGSYVYDGNPDAVPPAGASDVFVYTIKDGDGDTSTTTLTINLTDSGITASNDEVTVNEAALPVIGSTPASTAETVTGTVTDDIGGGTGPFTYALVGSGTGSHGTLTFNPDGSYSYTLTSPVIGSQADNSTNTENNAETFTYEVTDANGNTATNTITVDIVDDVPTVTIDNIGPADPTTVAEAGTITGDWSLTPGADGVLPANFKVSIDSGTAVPVSIGTGVDTGKGLLTFNADGTWTFVAATNLDNDVAQSVTFTLSATDGDGDTSADSHTISVTDGTNPSLSGGGLSLQMDDQNLFDGSTPGNPDFATGTVSFTAGSDALTNFAFAAGTGALAGGLTWNRVSDVLIEGWDGAVGTGTKIVALELTPPGSIGVGATGSVTVTATLINNYDSHPDINLDDLAALGSIGVVASDQDGDSVTQTVTLSVSDDLPALNIVDTPATVDEGQTINGTWTLAPGADGVTSVDVTVNTTTQSLSLTPSTNVVTFNLATGTLTVDADLQWHFTANSVTSNQQVTFSIKATDGDGDTSSDSQSITIQNVIQPLVIMGAVTGVVEEEHALPGGIDDTTSGTTPNLDTDVVGNLNNVTNAISGSFGALVTGGIDGTLSYSFASLSGNPAVSTVANGPLTSGGKPVLFAIDGGNLIGYVNSDGGTGFYSSAVDTKIFTVTLNSTTGAYSFTLNARVDHPIHNDSTEDAIAINLNGRVTVTDSGGPAPGDTNVPLNASITVIDDAPVAVSEFAVVNEGQKPSMNVVFVIDTSGSMGSGSGSRMELAKAAAINLLNNSSVDFNQIMVVSFASGASHNTPIWADRADAIAYISGLSASGNTDYDAALNRVTTNWGSGPTAADQTVVYFISDGEPTEGNGTVGIVGAEQTAWETFLADKGVAASYAVGISTGVNDADLTPIAWAPGNPGLPPVIITNAGDLSTTLTGSLPGSVSGNILSNGDGFGADGGYVKSITVDGVTFTFNGNATITASGGLGAGDVINANGKQITITTDLGGKLVFNFAANGTNQAGEWDYTAPNNIPATSPETFAYTLIDGDGDTVGASLNLTVNNINAAPSITSNGGGAIAAINVAENLTAVTTVTATDPDAGTVLAYSISGGADAAKFAINASTGALTFVTAPNFEAPTDSGTNNVYDVIVQVTDGSLTDTQAVAVTVTNVNEFAPVITSGATASVAENTAATTVVYTATATDADAAAAITYSITGADAALFNINSTSGQVRFNNSPNFEAPGDAGTNNMYDIVVHANDGVNDTIKAVAISVTNVDEAPVAQPDSVITNINDPSGNASETISIPISALLFNDSDPEGLPLTITSVTESQNNFAVSINGAEIDAVDRTGGGTFTYTLNTTPAGATDTADVTIDRSQQGQSQLDGTAANEILIGRDGAADTLVGGGGIDFLVGGTGADHFRLNALSEGGDHILDFSIAEGDFLDIALAGFTGAGLAVGSPTAAQFGSSATDTFGSAAERFHFNTATHTLLYDADGTGGGSAATVLAILDNGVNIAATNIHIV